MSKHDPRAGLCPTHQRYAMDCETFNALWKRARGCCEICDTPPERTPHGMLHIDHDDNIGHWGVRGLLCSRCNSSLHRAILDPARVAAYLADPWWEHILKAYGVPATGIPEPPIGAYVSVGRTLAWRRTERGWEQETNMHLRRGCISEWSTIATHYGPHRVRVGGSGRHPETPIWPAAGRAVKRAARPVNGGRSLTARNVVMAAKFSPAEAEIIDTARGEVNRSEWLRTVALAAAGQPVNLPVGARAPAGKPGSPPGRVPFRSPEPCPHPKARVHKSFCGACGTHVG